MTRCEGKTKRSHKLSFQGMRNPQAKAEGELSAPVVVVGGFIAGEKE